MILRLFRISYIILAIAGINMFLTNSTFAQEAQVRSEQDQNGIWYSDNQSKTEHAPNSIEFNNLLIQSHVGLDHQIYISRCVSLGVCTEWTNSEGETNQATAFAVFQNKLYQVHRGQDRKIYSRFSDDAQTWSSWQEYGGETNVAIGMAAFGNRLCQVHTGLDKKIYLCCSLDGKIWGNWQASGGQTSLTVSVTTYSGRLFESHRGEDSRIYTRFCTDTNQCSDWEQKGGETNLPVTLTFINRSTLGKYLIQAHTGLDNQIYYRSYYMPGNEWSPWFKINGTTNSNVSAYTFGLNKDGFQRICIAQKGLNQNIYNLCF